MAVEVTVPMDDKELFQSAMADTPAETVITDNVTTDNAATTEQQPREQPRDEHGRFAPKTAEAPQADAAPTQQQPEAVTETDDGAQVPSWRAREIREERDAARRAAEEAARQAYAYQQQMSEMRRHLESLQKPKQEPVDFFADPNAAFKQQVSPIEDRIGQLESNFRMATSRLMAIAEYGKEAVLEAEKAVEEASRNNDPALQPLFAQLRGNSDPVGTAVKWHSNQKLMKETGGNIAAYRDKILADAMKDPTFQAKVIEAARGQTQATPGTRPNIQLPPSLNKTAGSGVTASELADEDMSDRALFRYAAPGR